MEDGNPSALTPMAGKVSKLQEDCDSDRSTRDGLGLCGGGYLCSLFWHSEAALRVEAAANAGRSAKIFLPVGVIT